MKKCILTFLLLLTIIFSNGQSVLDTMSYQEKVQGISTFWREATYNFVFFDKVNINWDSIYYQYLPKAIAAKNVYEYYNVVSEFASLLKDRHTGLMTPDYFWKEVGAVPIFFRKIGNKRFVAKIDERLVEEIPIGTEVVAINNKSIDSFNATFNSWNGLKGTDLLFTFKNKKGETYTKVLQRVAGKDPIKYVPLSSWLPLEVKHVDKKILYVKINTFADSSIPNTFASLLPQIQSSKFLIIDIRDNGGGNSDIARRVAEHLVDKPFTVGSAWKSRINNSANRAWGSMILLGNESEEVISNQMYLLGQAWDLHPGDTVYAKKDISKVTIPIVVLIGPSTFSAAEDFLIFLDGSKNIKIIGQPTAGSSGQPLFIKLPKGLSARICSKRDTYPDGREFINIGIQPDLLIEKNVDHVFQGIDTELVFAINYLTNNRR